MPVTAQSRSRTAPGVLRRGEDHRPVGIVGHGPPTLPGRPRPLLDFRARAGAARSHSEGASSRSRPGVRRTSHGSVPRPMFELRSPSLRIALRAEPTRPVPSARETPAMGPIRRDRRIRRFFPLLWGAASSAPAPNEANGKLGNLNFRRFRAHPPAPNEPNGKLGESSVRRDLTWHHPNEPNGTLGRISGARRHRSSPRATQTNPMGLWVSRRLVESLAVRTETNPMGV